MQRLLLVSLLLLALIGKAKSAVCNIANCASHLASLDTQGYCTCLLNQISTCTGDNLTLLSTINSTGCDGCRLLTSLPLIIGAALLVLFASRK